MVLSKTRSAGVPEAVHRLAEDPQTNDPLRNP
jgi:hypothetical protein